MFSTVSGNASGWSAKPLLLVRDTVLRHVPLVPGARILDAGSGSGFMARQLATRDPQGSVVGVDLNPDYVTYAQRRAAAEGLSNLSFQQGDLQALPFEAASFDIVWSHLVLYFVPRPEPAVAEFRRVLKSGGRLIVALQHSPLMTNYPEDPDLQGRIQRVIPKLGDVLLARKLPLMLLAAGFSDVSVSAEMDRIFTNIGPIHADQRRNMSEILSSGMHRIAETLGGMDEAERFLADLSPTWTVPTRAATRSFGWYTAPKQDRAVRHGDLGTNTCPDRAQHREPDGGADGNCGRNASRLTAASGSAPLRAANRLLELLAAMSRARR